MNSDLSKTAQVCITLGVVAINLTVSAAVVYGLVKLVKWAWS